MMMKKLVKTLGFILAVVGPSVVSATATTTSQQDSVSTPPNTILNKVCIESLQIPGVNCDTAIVTIIDNSYACESIVGSHTIVPSNGRVQFTCKASDTTVGHNFKIDCGNGTILSGYKEAGQSFRGVCAGYEQYTPYHVACYVDDQSPTNPACKANLGYELTGDCGNGEVDPGEYCDLGGAEDQIKYCSDESCTSEGDSEYYCLNCAIKYHGHFLYEPAECRYSDTPISVMNNEVVPYWWKLYNKNTQEITDDEADCKIGYQGKELLLKDSFKCHFVVYNGLNNQSNPEQYISSFVENDCFNYNGSSTPEMFKYFKEHHNWNGNKGPDGINYNTVDSVTSSHSQTELGEYKLVLKRVEYKVCDASDGKWKDGDKFGAICEVNFAVTEPYIMQISTFGVNPVGSSNEFLNNYYSIDGSKILTRTDLNNVIKTDNSDYAVESNIESKFREFKEKYESLAVEVKQDSVIKSSKGNTTISNIFDATDGKVNIVKKVPNKSIYFIKGTGKLRLSQDKVERLTNSYTLIVEGMDVEIVGNVLQYAMIVTNQQMSFKDAGGKGTMGCADGGQVVQGIYVALGGFKAANEQLKNTSKDKLWCPRGGLHVKGVLIGDDIDKISNNKRSQLNSWFNAPGSSDDEVKKARRETIIKGASLLIEYSPSLWKTLPPGAEIFTESLEVYRK